jgi:aryl-alcohol dehydrogenase-like predicted oxidoreductase
MEYVQLGTSDLRVSRISLGCMSFGDPTAGFNEWCLPYGDAAPLFRHAIDLGITFWDTANVYGYGTSEEVVGRAIKDLTRREDIVLATKVGLPMDESATGSGLSRNAILTQADASLRRLGTDYIDLYQIHRFDPLTPVEETMEALDYLVRHGKVRAIGASSMWAWQFAKMQHAADLNEWTPFVSMQNQYSLVQREDERELFGLLADQSVSSIPWSPVAKGRLTRPWGETTRRSDMDQNAPRILPLDDSAIVNSVEKVAESRGVPMAQVALAWVLRNPNVAAPIVGITKAAQLEDAAAAVDIALSEDEALELESVYTPRLPTGFR